MALNNGGYSNNTQRKNFEDSYYSRFLLSDGKGKYLKVKFWAGKLALSIAVGDDSNGKFQYKETATIFLNPFKAKALADVLKEFIADKNHKPVGVVVGAGDPSSCATFMYKDGSIVLNICKVTGDGARTDSDNFVFQSDYHYSVLYKNFDKIDFEKQYRNDIEVDALEKLLEDFYRSSNSAYAYAVMDLSRYSYNRLKSNTEAIMDKLGIQRQSSKGPGFFTNDNGNGSSTTSASSNTVDDIDDLL